MRGSRLLTSFAIAVAFAGLAAPTVPATASPAPIGLHGTLVGRWQVVSSTAADAGVRYRLFRGYGTTSLGVTGTRGETGSLGNVRSGTCMVSLRVTTASPAGQISVAVSSLNEYPGGASCKGYNFRWRATGTSGAYAGRSGSGTGSFAMHNPTAAGADGTFKIHFH
ncbi:MAG: hypothetical protein JO079_02615 [Frankiaceae bacterium]|nr:hypothetical protein [Frankiaceae bacterium]MBV9368696.1 hypothetical protein [Frankiales bacterium]